MTDTDHRISAAIGWAILLTLVLGGAVWFFLGWWIAGAAAGGAAWILWAAYVEDSHEPPAGKKTVP